MLRIEREGRSVQVRLPRGAGFPEDGGLLLVREVASIEDVWLGAPVPRPGRERGDDGDTELLLALESEAEGLTRREVAVRLWGRERVAEEYYDGSWMHTPRQAPPGAGKGDPETVSRHGDRQIMRGPRCGARKTPMRGRRGANG